jgi:hypothetical protein
MLRSFDRRLDAYAGAALEATDSGEFGAELRDFSRAGAPSFVSTDLAPHAMRWLEDFKPRLAKASERARVRLAIAARLDRLADGTEYTARLSENLKRARRSAAVAIRLADGKTIRRWDVKTGNSRVDPDDAREEANRFSKRLTPKLLELIKGGAFVTYCVFTTPNVERGKLHQETRRIYRKFSNLLRRCKRGKIPGCSTISGAAVVLEAPLGCRGDWNVHLNVMLVHQGPFIDYGELRRAWYWQVEFRRVHGTEAGIAAAMREVIKYAVQTVAEKSESKTRRGAVGSQCGDQSLRPERAADAGRRRGALGGCAVSSGRSESTELDDRRAGRPATAPAFVDWSDDAILEWLEAFRRFRRTRTYGQLYRLPKPAQLELWQFVHLGLITWHGSSRGYVARFPLLDSIPGDKSTSPAERWEALKALLRGRGPPAVARPLEGAPATAAQAS